MDDLKRELSQSLEGEVRFDKISKVAYSVDASIYEIEPLGVVLPKSHEDLIQAITLAQKYQVPIIPRGAATGITGGCLGKGLVVDLSKYLNQIQEINDQENYAVCEAGVVQDQLNRVLGAKGYRLGPDTSTGNRATLGGMTANNSAGARSLRYGKMVDHVQAVELILGNGELLQFHALDEIQLHRKLLQNDQEGNIYRELIRIKETYTQEILSRFPLIPRRVSGYNLDELTKPGLFNACKVITGSEGTLGTLYKIKVDICKKPKALALCVIHFHDILEAMKIVEEILTFHPMAVEMMDDQILSLGRQSPSIKNKLEWLQGHPSCLFAVEFEGEDQRQATDKALMLQQFVEINKIGYRSIVLSDSSTMSHVWEVRKAGLGLLLSKRTYSRAIAFIEDLSIAPEKLHLFMSKFLPYLKAQGKEAGIYGHVGSGCLHMRPYLNLKDPTDVKLLQKIMWDVSDLVLEHGGALSGEHGDGLIRSWLNEKMFGKKIYKAFKELKAAFDPWNQMNPGKIIDAPAFPTNFRSSPQNDASPLKTFMDFSREGGLELAVDLCNGNGLCRKKEGLMCPSFQATGDEYDTTRARAQALKAVIQGQLSSEALSHQDLYDILDLCLGCKGCKTECPSQVDMAKMKVEVLYHYQKKHGIPLRHRLFAHIGTFYRLGSFFPSFFNWLLTSAPAKKIEEILGIAQERTLPLLATQRFSTWFKKWSQSKNLTTKVLLFNDTFTEFNQPEIGQAAVKVLNHLGYYVILLPWRCCGRPMISKGLLSQAQKHLAIWMDLLYPYANQHIPIIGLEPSCILTFRDEVFGLLPHDIRANAISEHCFTLDEFLEKQEILFKENTSKQVLKFHGHCYQKALTGTDHTMKVLRSIPNSDVIEIDSGCCGMAGAFGYEQEHYAISMKISTLQLTPALKQAQPTDLIVANGFSCRSQIIHTTGKRARHLAEVVADMVL